MEKPHVLVVDDQTEFLSMIKLVMRDQFEITCAVTAKEGLDLAEKKQFSAILLDLHLNDANGIEVCGLFRNLDFARDIPIIMLSGNANTSHKVSALLGGADDFMEKPFSFEELTARIVSRLRRLNVNSQSVAQDQSPLREDKVLNCGNLSLDPRRLEVRINNSIIPLTLLEFNLLHFFVAQPEIVLGRDVILRNVWKRTVVSPRTIDTHIALLRKKLLGFSHSIHTIYGAGYVLKKSDISSQELRQPA